MIKMLNFFKIPMKVKNKVIWLTITGLTLEALMISIEFLGN